MNSDREEFEREVIERDVTGELAWNLDLDATDMAVSVPQGVVTLTRLVKGVTDKYWAEVAAKRVRGMVSVANDSDARSPSIDQRTDPEIGQTAADCKADAEYAVRNPEDTKRPVQEAFRRNAEIEIKSGRNSVEADCSVATLKGLERSWAQRDEAERAAWWAPGATKVIDQSVVSP